MQESTSSPSDPSLSEAGEFTFTSVSPEYRREGKGWLAAFNPNVERQLDIDLVQTLHHSSVVCCVHFSRDGRYLATGCNRTAQVFETQTGEKVCELTHESETHTGDLYVRSVRFSPNGKLLATGAEDRQVRVWDIACKRLVQVYDGHKQEVYSIDFSLDGRFIVSGSGDKTVRVWDLHDNSCQIFTTVQQMTNPWADRAVTSVAISPQADLVAAGSLDYVTRVWDLASGTLLDTLQGHTNSVYSVAFLPNRKGLVTASLDKTLKSWNVGRLIDEVGPNLDAKDGGTLGGSQFLMDFIGPKDYALSACVSGDSRWVVSGSKDRSVYVWDAQTAALQLILQGHKNSVISVALSSENDLLATGSGDSSAKIWRLTRV